MKVYLCMVCQWYEDSYILGVYSTKELAEVAGQEYLDNCDEFNEMYVNVREFTIDRK
jgi:hypothetical protein